MLELERTNLQTSLLVVQYRPYACQIKAYSTPMYNLGTLGLLAIALTFDPMSSNPSAKVFLARILSEHRALPNRVESEINSWHQHGP